MLNTFQWRLATLLLIALLASSPLAAQTVDNPPTVDVDTSGRVNNVTTDGLQQSAVAAQAAETSVADTLARLQYIQEVLSRKLDERSALGERIEAANEQDKADLRRQADDLTDDIKQLRITLEAQATGGVDTSLFVEAQDVEESDWRKDVALIAQPVIDSLKEITDKPRRLKALNDEIALHQQELEVATRALDTLEVNTQAEEKSDAEVSEALQRSLRSLERTWTQRRDDASSAIEIAKFQIASLQGDKSLPVTIYEALVKFIKGRGLTLLLAVGAALVVWFGIRFLMRGYRKTLVDKSQPESRTRYRLAEYSMHAMTAITILIAIFIVFYQRGDVLLLGLLILLIVGLALGIRTLLPRYVSEARLLLNIGPMREAERILYRDLPWRVESINMYTVLRNPELHGVLRIPLADLHGISSRPAGKDRWFPTSRGDVVLVEEGKRLLEVIDQNPDTVELRHRGGQVTTVPTTDFYNEPMVNLTRGGSFGVMSTFGIDYDQQDISTHDAPRLLRTAIREALTHTDLSEFVKDVEVELKEAGSSSLDYWLFITMDSKAAKSWYRIKRMVQTACVDTCSAEGWNIPFPHLSVVQKRGGDHASDSTTDPAGLTTIDGMQLATDSGAGEDTATGSNPGIAARS